MPGKRKDVVRHRDIVTSTFDLKEKQARGYIKTLLGEKRLSWIEQAQGSTNGVPDVFINRGEHYGLLPTELKVSYRYMHNPGKQSEPKYVQVRHVQPSQLDWHRRHFELGGYSIILVMLNGGVSPDTSWWALCEGWKIRDWMEGMQIDRLFHGKDMAEVLGVEAVY